MTELDIVNACLWLRGETSVTSLDTDDHPDIPTIRQLIGQTKKDYLSTGHWFNRFRATLLPETDGSVHLPEDTLLIREVAYTPGTYLAQQGSLLVDTSGDPIRSPVTLTLIRDLPIGLLPYPAFRELRERVVAIWAANFIKDPTEVQEAQRRLQGAELDNNAEETRQVQHNALWSTPGARKQLLIRRRNWRL